MFSHNNRRYSSEIENSSIQKVSVAYNSSYLLQRKAAKYSVHISYERNIHIFIHKEINSFTRICEICHNFTKLWRIGYNCLLFFSYINTTFILPYVCITNISMGFIHAASQYLQYIALLNYLSALPASVELHHVRPALL